MEHQVDKISLKVKMLLFLYVFSLCNDLLVIPLGFTMPLHQLITLFLVPKVLRLLKELDFARYIMRPLWFEWRYLLVLSFIFGLVIPWEYMDYLRTFTQTALPRSIISVCRFFLEICSIIVPLVFIIRYRLSLEVLLNFVAYAILLTFGIAIIDFVLGFPIKSLLGARLIELRITGLNGEPRSFGKIMLMGFVIITFAKAKFKSKPLFIVTQLVTIVGLLLSSSASALFAFFVVILPISLFFWKKELLIIPATLAILVLPNVDAIIESLVSSDIITEKTLGKIEAVVGEERVENDDTTVRGGFIEPEFFKRFEIFDRAALNFLYDEPLYFFIGTGPNLISIPSSEYVNDYDRSTYGEVINSVPHTFLINVLSRSGIIGVVLVLLVFFLRMSRQLHSNNLTAELRFFWQLFFVNLLIANSLYYFTIGLILISLYVTSKTINYNTHSELR